MTDVNKQIDKLMKLADDLTITAPHMREKALTEIRTKLKAALMQGEPVAQIPDDFWTHKESWRAALVKAQTAEVTESDKLYWQHELRAFDQAYQELENTQFTVPPTPVQSEPNPYWSDAKAICNLPAKYKLSEDGLSVTDTSTNLTWMQKGSGSLMTEEETHKFVEAQNKAAFAGFTDWRLPTVHELFSLVDTSKHNPAINPVFNCESRPYWTASQYPLLPAYAWFVHFSYGGIGAGDKTYDGYFVRLVRSKQ